MTDLVERLREMPVVTVEQIARFRDAVFAGIAQLERENAALRRLLRKASGPMSYERWDTDFRKRVERNLK